MCVVPAAGGARGPAGLLRRAPLARPARVLQVRRLRQVSDGPALHGRAGRPLLLSGVQEERRGLRADVKPGGQENQGGWMEPRPLLFAFIGLLPVFQRSTEETDRSFLILFTASSTLMRLICFSFSCRSYVIKGSVVSTQNHCACFHMLELRITTDDLAV